MKLFLAALVLSLPSLARADNFQVIGPRGQYTFGSVAPNYYGGFSGYAIQNGQYSQFNYAPSYGYGYGYYGYRPIIVRPLPQPFVMGHSNPGAVLDAQIMARRRANRSR